MIRWILAATLIVTAAGCSTVPRALVPSSIGGSKDVPEDSMRALASIIEDTIDQGNRDHNLGDYEGIAISTPEIQQAIRTRAARHEVLAQFLDTGHAWERADGMIHIRRSKEYKQDGDRRSRDRDALLVMSENNDRWTLYEGLIDANSYPRGDLDAIRGIFAEARVAVMDAGQLYENSAGEAVAR